MGFIINLIVTLGIGGVCGCVAGKLMNSEGSLVRNVILGVIGGFVGGIALGIIGVIGIHFTGIMGWIMNFVFGVLGSCAIIWAAKKFF